MKVGRSHRLVFVNNLNGFFFISKMVITIRHEHTYRLDNFYSRKLRSNEVKQMFRMKADQGICFES